METTIRAYDRIAKIYYRRWDRISKEEKKLLDKLVNYVKGRVIIDMGCGTGKDAEYLSKLGYEVYGVDLSEGMLYYARKRGIKTIKADVRNPPFPDNFADGILSNSVVAHLKPEDRIRAYKEWYRILKPEGILLVIVQNGIFPKYIQRQILTFIKTGKFKFMYANYDGREWYYPVYTSFLRELREVGFEIIEKSHPFKRWLYAFGKKA